MRPPLSPRTDYALRTACALVLQDYKPSDVIYEEQFGDLREAQEDHEYETVRSAVERELESPLAPVNTTTTRALRKRTMSGDRLFERNRYDARPGMERSPQSEDWRDSRGQRRSLLERAEELRSRLNLEPLSPTEDTRHHQRSASSPLMFADVAPSRDVVQRSTAGATSDFMMTEGVTPGTEDEEYSWTASTAPTTAGVTTARTSNRTSNILRAESANNSTAKFRASDTEWMREELEKYKKAQDEPNARRSSGELAPAGPTTDQLSDTRDVSGVQVPRIPPIPARKPVPRPGAESRQSTTSHSRPSGEISRSGSKKRRSTPLSESKAEIGLLRPESRQANEEPEAQAEQMPQYATASHSFHAKPLSGIAAPFASHNVSQAGSRSRSITRQIREYIRPSSRIQSREASRPESRARSIESFTSSVTPSVESSSKWRRFKPFGRNRDSGGSDDFSTPESGDSRRGRKASQDVATSPKGKLAVNLNRELPPLPSLDQWKDVDAVLDSREAESEPVTYEIKRHPSTGRNVISPVSSRSQKPSVDLTISEHPRDSVLVDNTPRIHPKRMSSLRARTEVAQSPLSDPVSISLPQSPAMNMESMRDLRQSRSIQEFTPGMSNGTNNASLVDVSEGPAVPPKDINIYPRANGNLGRTMSQRMPIAPRRSGTSNTDLHSRTISDQPNFSRKISSEDYTRMHDMRYKGVPETPQRKPVPARTAPVEPEKPKKKWWQPSSKLKKRRQSWIALTGG